jgi:hypothetical protein
MFHFCDCIVTSVEFQLGCVVSLAGALGTIQLIFYKQFWTKHFSDMTLMLSGCVVMLLANGLAINWAEGVNRPAWEFGLAFFMVYSVGYPLGNSAILGSFSTLQKVPDTFCGAVVLMMLGILWLSAYA